VSEKRILSMKLVSVHTGDTVRGANAGNCIMRIFVICINSLGLERVEFIARVGGSKTMLKESDGEKCDSPPGKLRYDF
jgi:hypothetical protein